MKDNRSEDIDRHYKLACRLYDDMIKSVDLLDQHLKPCGEDLILLTLKGHLIIERLLEMNLSLILGVENLPRLRFSDKLKLLQAAVVEGKPGPNTDLFMVIEKLNEVRNSLAHNLRDNKEIEVETERIIVCLRSRADKKESLGKSSADRLRSCVHKLCKFLLDVRVHIHKTTPLPKV
jgi:hypothetical protein